MILQFLRSPPRISHWLSGWYLVFINNCRNKANIYIWITSNCFFLSVVFVQTRQVVNSSGEVLAEYNDKFTFNLQFQSRELNLDAILCEKGKSLIYSRVFPSIRVYFSIVDWNLSYIYLNVHGSNPA